MSRPDYRTLGLTVPVADALDPELWRRRYAYGIDVVGETPTTKAKTMSLADRIAAAKKRLAIGCAGATDQEQLDTFVTGIPDDVIRWHLRAALSEVEMKLGCDMGIQVCKAPEIDDGLVLGQHYDRQVQRLPYTHGEAAAWFRIDLPDSHVISVERVRAYYYGTRVWEISDAQDNTELVKLTWARQGVIHILPTNLQSLIVTQGGNYGVWHTLFAHKSPIPDVWSVDYTTGPIANNGEIGKIEAVLAHWVYCAAGIMMLSLGGLSQSKGLTSTSIGMDGVSRSIGLQASAMYGINSAAERVFDEAMKRVDWKQLKVAKRGLICKMFSH